MRYAASRSTDWSGSVNLLVCDMCKNSTLLCFLSVLLREFLLQQLDESTRLCEWKEMEKLMDSCIGRLMFCEQQPQAVVETCLLS